MKMGSIVILTIWVVATLILMIGMGRAQEHEHGQNGVVDWYDPSCCSRRDCKPVDDADIEFTIFEGQVAARHKPTGNIFLRHQFRPSQDERYHVCINTASGASLCFYDRAGA